MARKHYALGAPNYADVYHRLLARATTINKLNNLHILLEQRLTPGEVISIADRVLLRIYPPIIRWLLLFPARLAGAVARQNIHLSFLRRMDILLARRNWIANQEKMLLSANPDFSDAFRRYRVGPQAFLFKHSQSQGALLIGFAPRVRRLSVSMPLFLAALEPTHADFLIIRPDLKQASPWLDVPGFPPGFEGFVAGLAAFIRERDYRQWHTIGLSFSAPLALVAGIEIEARTVTPIGLTKKYAKFAEDMPLHWERLQNKATTGSSAGSPVSQVQVVYGELDEQDAEVASEFRKLLPGSRSIAVLGGGHSPLGHVFRNSELTAFLSSVIKGFTAETSPPGCRVDSPSS